MCVFHIGNACNLHLLHHTTNQIKCFITNKNKFHHQNVFFKWWMGRWRGCMASNLSLFLLLLILKCQCARVHECDNATLHTLYIYKTFIFSKCFNFWLFEIDRKSKRKWLSISHTNTHKFCMSFASLGAFNILLAIPHRIWIHTHTPIAELLLTKLNGWNEANIICYRIFPISASRPRLVYYFLWLMNPNKETFLYEYVRACVWQRAWWS